MKIIVDIDVDSSQAVVDLEGDEFDPLESATVLLGTAFEFTKYMTDDQLEELDRRLESM